MTIQQITDRSELLESRPEKVLRNALRRECVEIGSTKLFFSVVPADSDVISSSADFVYPNAGEPDRRGRELVVKESDGRLPDIVDGFIKNNPAEFPFVQA
jgi:hypothetical protein